MSQSSRQFRWADTGDLLLPKLSPPRLPKILVAREHLLEQMDQALVHDLTLISASAGFGKTTLLSAWVARCAVPVAWLSLEEQDNDPLRFWSYAFTALRTFEPQGGEMALSMLQSPQPPALTTILTALINHLARGEQQMVLVLDDFHIIEHPTILDSFQFFLEHLPAHVHLVLAGRTDPHLSLPRLRARGQIFELNQLDLRFTWKETASFLNQAMGLSLTREEVTTLEQRAEGWIAGLQLAALASRARQNPSAFVRQLSGNQRYILEYMQEEVLERQPATWQDFLLHTSILERLNPSLCQAVTAGKCVQTSQQLLDALERANLFLVPLDEERTWYRFHSLFRDVLQARLQAVAPELLPTLHQRAARWYAEQGHTFEAVEHALTGTAFPFAAELMERASRRMWSSGETERLYTWLQRLPDTEFLAHGRIVLTTVLQLLYQTYFASEEQWTLMLQRTEQISARVTCLLEEQAATTIPEGERQVLHNRLGLLHGWISTRGAIRRRNEAEVRRLGVQTQELARDEDMVWKMIPTFILSAYPPKNWLSMLSELKQQAEQEGNLYEATWIMSMLGKAYRLAGQLHAFHQICTEALREALRRFAQIGRARARFGYIHLDIARIQREWNQRDKAQVHLQVALDFARTWQHVDIQARGYECAIQLLLAEGELERAEQTLIELEPLARQSQWTHHRSMFATSQVRIWLAQGKLAQAAEWAAHTSIDLSRHETHEIHERDALTLVRVYLALQRHIEALRLLDDLLAWAERHQQVFLRMHFLALQVVALYSSGETLRARQVAAHLLSLTESEGYVRVYLDAGQPMRAVLQSLLADPQDALDSFVPAIPMPYVTSLLAAFEQDAARGTNQNTAPGKQPQHTPASSLLEPLTPRELEVLQLVAQGATNQAIAEQLVVSLATAKKHMTNLLGKLGAENRVQAIARAREEALL